MTECSTETLRDGSWLAVSWLWSWILSVSVGVEQNAGEITLFRPYLGRESTCEASLAGKEDVGKGNWGFRLFPLTSRVCFRQEVPTPFWGTGLRDGQQSSWRERVRLWPSTLNVVSWVSVQKC